MAVRSSYSQALGAGGMKRGEWATDSFTATSDGTGTGTVNFAAGFERNIGAGAVPVDVSGSVLRMLRIRNTHAGLAVIVTIDGFNVGTLGPYGEMTEFDFDTAQSLTFTEATGVAVVKVLAYFSDVVT